MFADKDILVIGAGVSGFSAALAVAGQKARRVRLNDLKEIEISKYNQERLKRCHVECILGSQPLSLLEGVDFVVVSPGIPRSIPILVEADRLGIPVISEIEVAAQLCPCPILALTGTNGKTTTVMLVAEIMKRTGRPVIVGGNIGMGLAEQVVEAPKEGIVVAEISSYQLESTQTFQPQVSAVLNVTPDHLERHKTMEVYRAVKERIFLRQSPQQTTVLNYDDPLTRSMAADAPCEVRFFSMKERVSNGAFYEDGTLFLAKEGKAIPLCERKAIHLLGDHNVENCLAAMAMADAFGVEAEAIRQALQTFSGVEHRIEPVREVRGVWYYNDSKGTNVDSSIKALESFDSSILLIAGGYDKGNDLTEFMALAAKKTVALLLIGNAAERFEAAAVKAKVPTVIRCSSMADAVKQAYELAEPGQTVLLSPACSSYDMFRCFEERGTVFKELVYQLKE